MGKLKRNAVPPPIRGNQIINDKQKIDELHAIISGQNVSSTPKKKVSKSKSRPKQMTINFRTIKDKEKFNELAEFLGSKPAGLAISFVYECMRKKIKKYL